MLALDKVLKPIEEARGLPSQLYINDSLTDRERQRVFFDHWAGLTNGALCRSPVASSRWISSAFRFWWCATRLARSRSSRMSAATVG